MAPVVEPSPPTDVAAPSRASDAPGAGFARTAFPGTFRRYQELVAEAERRQQAEAATAKLVPALERAREDAASLRKIVPVCPSCKRIRDTRGNWYEMETYLEIHYMTRVNDGLCPGCARDAYVPSSDRMRQGTMP